MGSRKIFSGLVWKEWKDNRKYLLAIALIINGEFILYPLMNLLNVFPDNYLWGELLSRVVFFAHDSKLLLAKTLVCLFLGVFILNQERQGSLEYLVTTPASRRQIIKAKLLVGVVVIIGMVMIQAAFFIYFGRHLTSVHYGVINVINWAILTSACFTALFCLGLFCASLTGTIAAGCLVSASIAYLPAFLGTLFIESISSMNELYKGSKGILEFIVSNSWLKDSFNISISYLTLPFYLSRENRLPWGFTTSNYIDGTPNQLYTLPAFQPNYLVETLVLIAVSWMLFRLSVKIFERSSLEKNQRFILFPSLLSAFQGVISLVAAQLIIYVFYNKGLIVTGVTYLISLILFSSVFYYAIRLILSGFGLASAAHSPVLKKLFKIKFIGIVVGASVLLLVGIYAVYPKLMMEFLSLGRLSPVIMPQIYTVPLSKNITSSGDLDKGQTLACFGLSFSTPWGLQEKTETDKRAEFRFDERTVSIAFNSHFIKELDDFGKEYTSQNVINLGNYKSIYLIFEPILNSTPDQVGLFMPRQKALANLTRVLAKAEVFPRDYVAHLITPSIDAIQVPADLDTPPPWVVYDDDTMRSSKTEFMDRQQNYYTVIISGKRLRQSEVDAVISSIKIGS